MPRLLLTFVLYIALTIAAQMKVTADSLNVRNGPGTSYRILSSLKKGTIVNTSDTKNGWYQIGSGKWVSGSYLVKVSTSSSSVKETKCIDADSLNVRSGDGTSYSKVGLKKRNDKVTVYEYNADKSWARIGTKQWVSAKYLKKCGTTTNSGNSGNTSTVVSGAKCNLVNGNVIDTSKPFTTGTKYNYSNDDLKYLAYVAYKEQGSVGGAKIELSLMANLYEKSNKNKYKSVRDYVDRSNWFASSSRKNYKYPGDDYYAAAREVLNEGKRYIASDVVEHDCISDITSISTGSRTNRNDYIPGKTIIKNTYQSKYVFIGFAPNKGDPFGYITK